MRALPISSSLSLPLAVTTQKLAWLGVTGGGKTYAAMKLAELLWAARAQFIVLDPVGVWYGLRLAADGKRPSEIKIPILGGLHGDLPLEVTAGAMIADLIVDRGESMILDVSQFESDAEKARFAREFGDRFFFRKKAKPSAVHIFLEECQEFLPQNPQDSETKMLHAWTRIQKLGRNFGIGTSLISQRPQEVNKKALNMASTIFAFRTTGTHERSAIEKWIKDKALDQSIANDLPKLPTGSAHVWSPEFLQISEVVRISAKETFNASATPEVGAVAKSRELAPIDFAKLRADMAESVDRAKATDPKQLAQRVRELEREIAKKPKTTKLVATPMLSKKAEQQLAAIDLRLATAASELRTAAKHAADALAKCAEAFARIKTAAASANVALPTYAAGVAVPASAAGFLDNRGKLDGRPIRYGGVAIQSTDEMQKETEAFVADARAVIAGGKEKLGAGEVKILKAVAQHGTASRDQIGILTGLRRSTRNEYMSRLSRRGLIEIVGDQASVTMSGRAALPPDFEPLPTGRELCRHWLQSLPSGESRILAYVVAQYPRKVDREMLGGALDMKRSTRNEYIGRLARRKLVAVGPDGVRAAAELFD
jgi:hypothetical protein